MEDSTTRTPEEQPFSQECLDATPRNKEQAIPIPFSWVCRVWKNTSTAKEAAKEAIEMGFHSGKEMEELYGAEIPRSLTRAEAAEVTREEEHRFQLEHVWVPACEKSCH